MRLLQGGVAILVAGAMLACSQGSESTGSGPGLEVLQAALVERDPLERRYLLTSFLRSMGPEDASPVRTEFEKHRVGVEAKEVYLWMLAWTRFDGPGAFATARDWPTSWRSILMEETMRAWGFNDGRAALAETEKIEDEKLRERLLQLMVSGWLASPDRLGVSEYVATIENGKSRSRLAFKLAGEAKRDGADAVIAWVDSVPEDAPNGFKTSAFVFGSGALASLDPERAARWYEANMGRPYIKKSMTQIARKWAHYHDPRAAVEWIGSPPLEETNENERAEAYRSAFRTWAAVTPEEVEAWLENASAGPAMDSAIVAYSRTIGDETPGVALRWTEQIEDPKLRLKDTLKYSRRRFLQEPDAFRAWFEAADLPPDWRQQVEANLPRTGGRRVASQAEKNKRGKRKSTKGGGGPARPGRAVNRAAPGE